MTIYPPPKKEGWLTTQLQRGAVALLRFPRWTIPPIIGAALLFAMTVFRGMFLLLARPSLQGLLAFFLALVVATAAGAVAGAAFVVVRKPLRHLGFIGDLLTGVILGWVYLFSILVPAKYVFHDNELQTRSDWISAAVIGGGFGVLAVVVYWYNVWREKKGR